jgi:hypothetical protein
MKPTYKLSWLNSENCSRRLVIPLGRSTEYSAPGEDRETDSKQKPINTAFLLHVQKVSAVSAEYWCTTTLKPYIYQTGHSQAGEGQPGFKSSGNLQDVM